MLDEKKKQITLKNDIENAYKAYRSLCVTDSYSKTILATTNGYYVFSLNKKNSNGKFLFFSKERKKLVEINCEGFESSDYYNNNDYIHIYNTKKIVSYTDKNGTVKIKNTKKIANYMLFLQIKDNVCACETFYGDTNAQVLDNTWAVFHEYITDKYDDETPTRIGCTVYNAETKVLKYYDYYAMDVFGCYNNEILDKPQTSKNFILIPYYDLNLNGGENYNSLILQHKSGQIVILDDICYGPYEEINVTLRDNHAVISGDDYSYVVKVNNKNELAVEKIDNYVYVNAPVVSVNKSKDTVSIIANVDKDLNLKLKIIDRNGNVTDKEINVVNLKNIIAPLTNNDETDGYAKAKNFLSGNLKIFSTEKNDYIVIDEIGIFDNNCNLLYKLDRGQFAVFIDDKNVLIATNKYLSNVKNRNTISLYGKARLFFNMHVVNLESGEKFILDTKTTKEINISNLTNLSPFDINENTITYLKPYGEETDAEVYQRVEVPFGNMKENKKIKYIEISKPYIVSESEIDNFIKDNFENLKNEQNDFLIVKCKYSHNKKYSYYICDFKNNTIDKIREQNIFTNTELLENGIILIYKENMKEGVVAYDLFNHKVVVPDEKNSEFSGKFVLITNEDKHKELKLLEKIVEARVKSNNKEKEIGDEIEY